MPNVIEAMISSVLSCFNRAIITGTLPDIIIDYCSPTIGVVGDATGEIRPTQIFVAVLGASNYTYAETTWSQGLAEWISNHIRAFEFFGGVTQLLAPGNLKFAVPKGKSLYPRGDRHLCRACPSLWCCRSSGPPSQVQG
uniref:Uncharacterized protein n=1 Tax=Candidatus Kentrum sp. SD TaxID=2126332 RepID=A0A450YAG7_9GAMM|nr:MAG: hypothetical protein BECKSD772F_GA0070984_100121 [Candidatus Kentron sp. SD]VFK38548.1 MAG: hypothetical protein BECKSD772E_GA0070983_100120 [Candidatus Kentron sp. SD]